MIDNFFNAKRCEIICNSMGSKTSRKTKRAWVKNIDLKDIEENLEESRDRKRIFGDEQEFVIDETADSLPKHVKKLKSSEILENKSKIPALALERNKRPKGKTVARLMIISGRIDNSTAMASVDKNGLINAEVKDLWDEEEPIPANLPERLPPSQSKVKKVRPSTITREPIKLDMSINDLHAGKSYNPTLESWKELINEEFGFEQIKELNRQQLIEKQEMLARILAEEVESSDEEKDDDDDDDNDTNDFKLSINKPTVTKKKTKAQRNKQVRHQKRVELEDKMKQLKKQIKEIELLDLESIDETNKPVKEKKEKKPKKLFKYNVMEKPLEVKLSDELSSNLKNLKAEGNLFYSNLINLQAKGLIETRVPVVKKTKYKPKITEKWTYKDFK